MKNPNEPTLIPLEFLGYADPAAVNARATPAPQPTFLAQDDETEDDEDEEDDEDDDVLDEDADDDDDEDDDGDDDEEEELEVGRVSRS